MGFTPQAEPNLEHRLQAALGKVSMTADGWSADTTKQGYLGLTGHWIDVTDNGKWVLRSEIVGFQAFLGDHSSDNLGRYCVGLLNRVGIISRDQSKVGILHFSVILERRIDVPSFILRLLTIPHQMEHFAKLLMPSTTTMSASTAADHSPQGLLMFIFIFSLATEANFLYIHT